MPFRRVDIFRARTEYSSVRCDVLVRRVFGYGHAPGVITWRDRWKEERNADGWSFCD